MIKQAPANNFCISNLITGSGLKWDGIAYWRFFGQLESIPPLLSDDCHTSMPQ